MGPRVDPRGRGGGSVSAEPTAASTSAAARSAASAAARSAASAAAPELEAWEVFRQEKDGDPMRHGGSVMAPDAELAVHYAREMYGRRQESVRLWVVRRGDILDLDDPDLLQPPLDRSFKKPGGYVMRDKLAPRAAAELADRSGQAQPKANAVQPDERRDHGRAAHGPRPRTPRRTGRPSC